MRRKELSSLGLGHDPVWTHARQACIASGLRKNALRRVLRRLTQDPAAYLDDEAFGQLAAAVARDREAAASFAPRATPAPYRRWGDDLDAQSLAQMDNACSLPVAVAGALMPDAHLGYGLPIGGVLATREAVIPYAVGVDIACRMKMTVLDLPVGALRGQTDRLTKTLERETRFGIGASFKDRRHHQVMDEADSWHATPLLRRLKDKAWAQLGTSGSGNHFVEYGELTLGRAELGLDPGTYLAVLSHSGSRGAGATIAGHYSRLAMDLHRELPKPLRHLAWLDLDSAPGQEYWQAMELMGRYAAANHACIHRHMARALGADVLLDVENHHNFAWREEHGGESVVVHRKGATPAGEGMLGIIPGSMASPAFVVRGRGNPASLHSAAHGAGRVMSRKQAKSTFTWSSTRKLLAARRVTLLSAGLDEVPMAYRDIEQVMAAQHDLVTTLGRFEPRIVKMAPAGERPED